MKISAKLRKRLGKLCGEYSSNDAANDEMNAILLQLTMALMMIFLIAFSLFRLKTNAELEPIAEIRAEQQLNFQRQELIMALERTEEYYRIRYGMKAFAYVDANEQIIYSTRQLLENGQVVTDPTLRNAFVNGAANSFNDYSAVDVLEGKWYDRVLAEASVDESTMQDGNRAWLRGQIGDRIGKVRQQMEDLQYQAASEVQLFLSKNPVMVKDQGVRSLLEQYIASPVEIRAVLINELDRSLKNYAFSFLKQQINTPLLRELYAE